MAHGPADHVMDEVGQWTIFTDVFGGLQIPLGPRLQIGGFHFQFTKFMMVELIAAGLICAIYIPLARRVARGEAPRGAWWNAFESLLTFIRNEVARPTLSAPDHEPHHEAADTHGGHAAEAHDGGRRPQRPEDQADLYVPFLWTIFLFILFCNLLGLVPFLGSPTASIWVTGALALISFVMMHGVAIAKMGFGRYLKSLWPAMEVPLAIGIFLKPMIFVIEVVGTVIKSFVLAVRLFANMFAGHMVLAMILFFIVQTANLAIWGGVTFFSVLGVTALSLLELFVAFLQAYIFTFLTALFMGMAANPQH
jgi:F-type H+-transporting ATPase subunit a